jgi:hypothetical protein
MSSSSPKPTSGENVPLQNPRKRKHDYNNDADVDVKKEVGKVSEDSRPSKKIKRKNNHQVQTEIAAAMLQDSLVHFDKINQKTSVEVLKVAIATTKTLLDENPNILGDLTEEQCKILIHLSRTILKNHCCKNIIRKPTQKKSKKGWKWWLWPL